MMPLRLGAPGLALLALVGCKDAGTPRLLEPVPPELSGRVTAAEAAMGALQQRLSQRLSSELARGGAAGAVTVCRDEAPGLTASVAGEHGLRLGRTSHKLRNPANAPPAWAAPYVAAAAGRKAAEVKLAVVDLGDRVGVLKPIPTAPLCTTCHGEAAALAPDVTRALTERYPKDAATGFAPGDVRGFFWAELPR